MTEKSPHSPLRTLMFLLLMGALVWSFSLLPEKVELTDTLAFRLPQWPHFQEKGQEQERLADANSFLEGYDDLLREDSIAEVKNAELREAAIEDSLAIEKQRRRKLLSIQEGPEGIRNLKSFFQTLMKLPESGKKVRVMHYGDSQIEADRITSYLRREWQKKWGGQGPGLVPPVEVVPSGNIKQRASEEWHRHTIYGRKDTTVKHTRFGALGTFASYDSTSASLFFEPSRLGYSNTRVFKSAKVFLGSYGKGGSVQLYQNEELIAEKTLCDSCGFTTLDASISAEINEIRLTFTGGPMECYGVAFDGNSGVQVDNIPMRGSSGTIFKKMDRTLFKQQISQLQPELLLLQYGGNSVPYVKDTAQAENYGKWLKSQIKYLQKVAPNAAIILIGPSDMAHKEGDQFETYAFLEPVRDALKKAAFETNCGFWDIYEAMGGQNSMQAWVEAEPSLAGSDYVHFTPKGAKKIAELFNKAVMDRYKIEQEQDQAERKEKEKEQKSEQIIELQKEEKK
ncbi:MAG: lysophospholipase L1-like esterase [Flavobacteriales bacterium]|jgi:lysophospholipase L1-like esterase